MLTTDNYHDVCAVVYWRHFVDEQPMFHRYAIGFADFSDIERATFQTVTTSNNDVVAVVEGHNPDIILALIEVSTGTRYPGGDPNDKVYGNLDAIIGRLRSDNPNQRFILRDQVPVGRLGLVVD
jgi:hypothetical protein